MLYDVEEGWTVQDTIKLRSTVGVSQTQLYCVLYYIGRMNICRMGRRQIDIFQDQAASTPVPEKNGKECCFYIRGSSHPYSIARTVPDIFWSKMVQMI